MNTKNLDFGLPTGIRKNFRENPPMGPPHYQVQTWAAAKGQIYNRELG